LVKAQHELNANGNDEAFLYTLVVKAGLGLPVDSSRTPEGKFYSQFRPLHGTHLSFNRGPGKRICTEVLQSLKNLLRVQDFGHILCHDKSLFEVLAKVTKDSFEQGAANMRVKDGVCKA